MIYLQSLFNKPPFVIRIVAEARELLEKINALHAFVLSDKFKDLIREEQILLSFQLDHMQLYLKILCTRLDSYGVDSNAVYAPRVGMVDELEGERISGKIIQVLHGESWDDLKGQPNYSCNPVFYRVKPDGVDNPTIQ